jgi:hypothetical protein
MFLILGNETNLKAPVAKKPRWMRVLSKGELLETATAVPVVKRSLLQRLCDIGCTFKSFFKDHAKIYRVV